MGFDFGKAVGDVGNWLGLGDPSLEKANAAAEAAANRIAPGHRIGSPLEIRTQRYNAPELDMKAGQIGTGPQDEARLQQMEFLRALQGQMAGTGPSLAQSQLQSATDANIKNAMALGAAQQGQGMGSMGALRGINAQQSMAQQQAVNQSAQIRNMEQLQAQQQMSGLLGNIRGQDIGLASEQARNAMGMQGMYQQGKLGFAGLQQGADLGYEGMRQQQAGAYEKMRAEQDMGFAELKSQAQQAAYGRQAPAQQAAYGRRGAAVEKGGEAIVKVASMLASAGGKIGGAPRVHGDSPVNDTVPILGSPGEAIIPRSIMEHQDAPAMAAGFVAALNSMKNRKPGMASGGAVGMYGGGDTPVPATFPAGASDAGVPMAGASDAGVPMAGRDDFDFPALHNRPTGPGSEYISALPAPDSGYAKFLGKRKAERAEPKPHDFRPAQEDKKPVSSDATQKKPASYSQGLGRGELSKQEDEMRLGRRDYEDALQMEVDAAQMKGDAQASLKQQEAVEAKNLEASRLSMEADQNAQYDKSMGEMRAEVGKFGDTKIDPKRLFKDMNGGQKALSIIGLALGSLGAGSTGGVNRAAAALDDLINRDIDAQKTDLDTTKEAIKGKQSLLGDMRQRFGDGIASIAASKAALKERYANFADELAAKSSGPEAAATAAKISAALRQSQAKDFANLDMDSRAKSAAAAADNARIRIEQQRLRLDAARIGAAGQVAGQKEDVKKEHGKQAIAAIDAIEKKFSQISAHGPYLGAGALPGTATSEYDEMMPVYAPLISSALRGPGSRALPPAEAMKYVKEILPRAGAYGGEAKQAFARIKAAIARSQAIEQPQGGWSDGRE